jgi:hypothetical protein
MIIAMPDIKCDGVDGGFMERLIAFEESELARIGIVCPNCGTESIFDLGKDQAATTARDCPGCGKHDFLESFTTEARQNYNWITYYKRGKEIKKQVRVRFYFDWTAPASERK